MPHDKRNGAMLQIWKARTMLRLLWLEAPSARVLGNVELKQCRKKNTACADQSEMNQKS
jgi:hypothetical protein